VKIGIIGEKNIVLAFNDLGMEVFTVEKDEDLEYAKQKIRDLAVLFVTETIADKYNLDDLYSKTLPAVLVIPGAKGDLGKGSENLKKTLERALGSELNI
jgi:V/A-type H+-transporting ATPase subunit F